MMEKYVDKSRYGRGWVLAANHMSTIPTMKNRAPIKRNDVAANAGMKSPQIKVDSPMIMATAPTM